MEVQAFTKSIRISSRKVKPIADLVRRQTPAQALLTLKFTTKKAAEPLSKTIASAIANAKHNFGLEEKTLRFKKLEILKGPTIKRYRFAARGRVRPILKRTTNIRVVLETAEQAVVKEPQMKKVTEEPKTTEVKVEKEQEEAKTQETKEEGKKPKAKKRSKQRGTEG